MVTPASESKPPGDRKYKRRPGKKWYRCPSVQYLRPMSSERPRKQFDRSSGACNRCHRYQGSAGSVEPHGKPKKLAAEHALKSSPGFFGGHFAQFQIIHGAGAVGPENHIQILGFQQRSLEVDAPPRIGAAPKRNQCLAVQDGFQFVQEISPRLDHFLIHGYCQGALLAWVGDPLAVVIRFGIGGLPHLTA